MVTISASSADFKFQHQNPGVGISTEEDLYIAMSMLKSYTIMIDDHCTHQRTVLASVLIDHRNTTQHTLLALPPRTGAPECLRLASLIYSLLVTFPLPYIMGTFQRLVTGLRLALGQWDGDDNALIWALMMGGIGAIGIDEERQWFVERLQELISKAQLRSWDELRTILKNVLWYEDTNGKDGLELWLQSQHINRSEMSFESHD